MRFLYTVVVLFSLALSVDPAQADPLSGQALKAKLGNSLVMLSRNGRKVRKRIEITLSSNGTGKWLDVRSGQGVELSWRVKGTNLCVTQKTDGLSFCMATAVEGNKIVAQMANESGQTRQLKGTVTPF